MSIDPSSSGVAPTESAWTLPRSPVRRSLNYLGVITFLTEEHRTRKQKCQSNIHGDLADAVDFGAGHRPTRIDERVEDDARGLAGVDADDGDFDDAVGAGAQTGGLEVEDGDRRVGNRECS